MIVDLCDQNHLHRKVSYTRVSCITAYEHRYNNLSGPRSGAICCDSTMRSICQRAELNPPQGRPVLWLKWRAYRLSNPPLFSHSYSRSMGFCCQRCKCFWWGDVSLEYCCLDLIHPDGMHATLGWLWSHVWKQNCGLLSTVSRRQRALCSCFHLSFRKIWLFWHFVCRRSWFVWVIVASCVFCWLLVVSQG